MLSKEIEIMKKNQIEVLELKNTITKKRNNVSQGVSSSAMHITEELNHVFKVRFIKISLDNTEEIKALFCIHKMKE